MNIILLAVGFNLIQLFMVTYYNYFHSSFVDYLNGEFGFGWILMRFTSYFHTYLPLASSTTYAGEAIRHTAA